MQRFGLMALLIAAVGVAAVVVFLPAGPKAETKLVGSWVLEPPDGKNPNVPNLRLDIEANSSFRLIIEDGVKEEIQSGIWASRTVTGNRLVLTLRIQKVTRRDPIQGEREQPFKGQMEIEISGTGPDMLTASLPVAGENSVDFQMRRVPK
jgi:hypothetical protein